MQPRRPTRGPPASNGRAARWWGATRLGAPVALPAALDAVTERWWRLPPRGRTTVAVLLVVIGLAMAGRGATSSPWGPPRPVLVAASDLPAGHALRPADTRPATWPAALVPEDALVAGDLAGDVVDIAGDVVDDMRLAGPAPAGTVLTRRHLVAGLAGLVDDGEAAVALPRDGLPTVHVGDHVDVVATLPDGSGRRAASNARVLALEDGFLWLGVPSDRVDAVAGAGAGGRLTLAVRPARPPP